MGCRKVSLVRQHLFRCTGMPEHFSTCAAKEFFGCTMSTGSKKETINSMTASAYLDAWHVRIWRCQRMLCLNVARWGLQRATMIHDITCMCSIWRHVRIWRCQRYYQLLVACQDQEVEEKWCTALGWFRHPMRRGDWKVVPGLRNL